MNVIDNYFQAEEKLFEYFGIDNDWGERQIEDCRAYYWRICGEEVIFSGDKKAVVEANGDHYSSELYREEDVYRAEEYTMAVVGDWHNLLLFILDNSKEVTDADYE